MSGVRANFAGFTDGTYRIEVRDPWGTQPTVERLATSVGGTLSFVLPDFTRDVAIKIRPAGAATRRPAGHRLDHESQWRPGRHHGVVDPGIAAGRLGLHVPRLPARDHGARGDDHDADHARLHRRQGAPR